MKNFPIVKATGGPNPSRTVAGIQQCFPFVLIEDSLSFLEQLPLFEPNVRLKKSGKRASIVSAHRWPEVDKRTDGIVIVQELINKPKTAGSSQRWNEEPFLDLKVFDEDGLSLGQNQRTHRINRAIGF